jgi:hypothetical protein
MLLRHLFLERYVQDFHTNLKTVILVEDAGLLLQTAAKALKQGAKLDIEALADTITAIKLLTNKDYRQAMTKDDVGINVNSSKELARILDKVPSNAAVEQPKDVRDFMRAVASLGKSMRKTELEKLQAALDNTKDREKAADELAEFATKLIAALKKLKTNLT